MWRIAIAIHFWEQYTVSETPSALSLIIRDKQMLTDTRGAMKFLGRGCTIDSISFGDAIYDIPDTCWNQGQQDANGLEAGYAVLDVFSVKNATVSLGNGLDQPNFYCGNCTT
jgi:hypothetical protein